MMRSGGAWKICAAGSALQTAVREARALRQDALRQGPTALVLGAGWACGRHGRRDVI